jgi:hypothetical protein
VSDVAKKTLWKVESERYAMISPTLRLHNPSLLESDDNGSRNRISYSRMDEIRAEAWTLFLALDLFFVKVCARSPFLEYRLTLLQVSEFMFIVPKFPHLRNIQLHVQYREIPPDVSWLDKLTFPGKWRQDPDAGSNYGFAPGAKVYINGGFIHEDKPKLAQTSKTPFPECRVPRIGLRQVFPNDPDYERICIQQGLLHLVHGRDHTINGHAISLNGSMDITPPESTNGETQRIPDAPTLGLSMVSNDVPNGVNGVL